MPAPEMTEAICATSYARAKDQGVAWPWQQQQQEHRRQGRKHGLFWTQNDRRATEGWGRGGRSQGGSLLVWAVRCWMKRSSDERDIITVAELGWTGTGRRAVVDGDLAWWTSPWSAAEGASMGGDVCGHYRPLSVRVVTRGAAAAAAAALAVKLWSSCRRLQMTCGGEELIESG